MKKCIYCKKLKVSPKDSVCLDCYNKLIKKAIDDLNKAVIKK